MEKHETESIASSVSHSSRGSRRSRRSNTLRESEPPKLETKEDLVEHIRKWIQNDNEIRQLQALVRERREIKKQITQELVDVMRDNEIEKFNLRDGKLVYKQTKRSTPLNEKHIAKCLLDIFKDDPSKAQEATEMIMNRREVKMVDTLQRRIDKNAKEQVLKSGEESIRKALLES
jgi:hypothetical protein